MLNIGFNLSLGRLRRGFCSSTSLPWGSSRENLGLRTQKSRGTSHPILSRGRSLHVICQSHRRRPQSPGNGAFSPPKNRLSSNRQNSGRYHGGFFGRLNNRTLQNKTSEENVFERARKQLLYKYFLWRKDTWSDLQLFMGINTLLLVVGSMVFQGLLVLDPLTTTDTDIYTLSSFWSSIYLILQIVLGQELPEESGVSVLQQVFAVTIAVIGLASFALILALIEQVVLEVLEGNVRLGSKVIEEDHFVLLCWGESSRDLNQTIRIVKELCAAQQGAKKFAPTIVVLIQGREKLEMEQLFDSAVPDDQRNGCKLVFRQGSPLDPASLELVSATSAGTVIICGDYSQRCRESDAQVLRSAILMDEAVYKLQRKPSIIAEIQTEEGLDLMNYTCSASVRPISTTLVNSLRTARLLAHPVASVVSHRLFEHTSCSFIGMYSAIDGDRLIGKTLSDIMTYFDYATPIGFCKIEVGEFDLNPDPQRPMRSGENIVLLQSAHPGAAQGLNSPFVTFDDGAEDPTWTKDMFLKHYKVSAQSLTGKSSVNCSTGRWFIQEGWGSSDSSMMSSSDGSFLSSSNGLPYAALITHEGAEYTTKKDIRKDIMISGWPGNSYSIALIKALDKKIAKEMPSLDCDCPRTKIVIINDHEEHFMQSIFETLRKSVQHIELIHTKCDPRNKYELSKALEGRLGEFAAAITLSDTLWIEKETTPGFALSSSAMMRMDALILTCQLNIRYLLEMAGSPEITFVAEKLSSESICTRFEDRQRMPLGAAVNSSSFAAKALAQEALLPGSIGIYNQVDRKCLLRVYDSSALSREGENVSYACLQRRAAKLQCILMGYYFVPKSVLDTVHLELNPQGAEEKTKKRVWNDGNGGTMFIVATSREFVAEMTPQQFKSPASESVFR